MNYVRGKVELYGCVLRIGSYFKCCCVLGCK